MRDRIITLCHHAHYLGDDGILSGSECRFRGLITAIVTRIMITMMRPRSPILTLGYPQSRFPAINHPPALLIFPFLTLLSLLLLPDVRTP